MVPRHYRGFGHPMDTQTAASAKGRAAGKGSQDCAPHRRLDTDGRLAPAVVGRRIAQRRGCVAADDRGGLVDQRVVGQRLDHEQGEVHTTREVARQYGIADVPAPDGQAFAWTLLEIAAAYNRPARIAREDPTSGLDLVVKVNHSGKTPNAREDLDLYAETQWIDILAIETDVPAAREQEPRARFGVVENRLRRARGVIRTNAPRCQDDEHSVAASDRAPNDV